MQLPTGCLHTAKKDGVCTAIEVMVIPLISPSTRVQFLCQGHSPEPGQTLAPSSNSLGWNVVFAEIQTGDQVKSELLASVWRP